MPRLVAMESASTGREASVFVIVALSLIRFRFVPFLIEKGFRHHVFFRGPIPQVQQPATLAAKREFGIGRGVHRFAANGAVVLHRMWTSSELVSPSFDIRTKGECYARMRNGVAVEICRAACIGIGSAERGRPSSIATMRPTRS